MSISGSGLGQASCWYALLERVSVALQKPEALHLLLQLQTFCSGRQLSSVVGGLVGGKLFEVANICLAITVFIYGITHIHVLHIFMYGITHNVCQSELSPVLSRCILIGYRFA